MDSEDDYEDRMDARVFIEQGYATGGYEEEREKANSSSSSEHGSDLDNPPVLSPPHTIDIPSVHRPPVPVMLPADRVSTHDLPVTETLPADRVSTHDLPLTEPLAVVERELFHTFILSNLLGLVV